MIYSEFIMDYSKLKKFHGKLRTHTRSKKVRISHAGTKSHYISFSMVIKSLM